MNYTILIVNIINDKDKFHLMLHVCPFPRISWDPEIFQIILFSIASEIIFMFSLHPSFS